MRFVNLSPNMVEQWDKVVHSSDDAWLFHLSEWLSLVEKVWNLESKSFLIEHEGQMIAVSPLQMTKNPTMLKSNYRGFGGVAVANDVRLGIRKKALKLAYEHIEEIAIENNVASISINLPPLSKFSLNNKYGINPLIHHYYSDVSTQVWLVDLRGTKDDILRNIPKRTRREITRAKEQGYTIKKVENPKEIDDCYAIYKEVYRRTGGMGNPEQYFSEMLTFLSTNNCGVFWKALNDGQSIAFEAIGVFKKGAINLAVCAKDEDMQYGVNYLLQYNSFLWAKSHGVEWFDMGEAFPNLCSGKSKGLSGFKRKWGCELRRFYKGEIVYYETSRTKKIHKLVDRVLDFLR